MTDLRDPASLYDLGRELEAAGDLRGAAEAFDSAYGVAPDNPTLIGARARVLDRLEVREHGLVFRYIPRGTFLMGSQAGDPDEQPVHAVTVSDFWLTDVSTSWEAYCRLLGWQAPPIGLPDGKSLQSGAEKECVFMFWTHLLRQYCEDETLRAGDPSLHWPLDPARELPAERAQRLRAGSVSRSDPSRPWGYGQKPLVGVDWSQANYLASRLTTPGVLYRLPSEAEWEHAARGGLSGAPYPWGSDPPTAANCDFNRFREFSLQKSRRFSPNGYGLYAMAGSVWEWTSDWYDAEYYRHSPRVNPSGPDTGKQKVIRGGSWADSADAVTVSFRMSRRVRAAPEGLFSCGDCPNIGFRLARVDRGVSKSSSDGFHAPGS